MSRMRVIGAALTIEQAPVVHKPDKGLGLLRMSQTGRVLTLRPAGTSSDRAVSGIGLGCVTTSPGHFALNLIPCGIILPLARSPVVQEGVETGTRQKRMVCVL